MALGEEEEEKEDCPAQMPALDSLQACGKNTYMQERAIRYECVFSEKISFDRHVFHYVLRCQFCFAVSPDSSVGCV